MPRILIVAFSPVERDPRVLRQVRQLSLDYDVTVIGNGKVTLPGVRSIELTERRRSTAEKVRLAALTLARRYPDVYWNHIAAIQQLVDTANVEEFDLVLANDIETVPAALRIARGRPVLADLHEYALDEGDSLAERTIWGPLKAWMCQVSLPNVVAVTTVSRDIADAYQHAFPGITTSVITNAPAYQVLTPSPITGSAIRLVHHGSGATGRGLEDLLEMMRHLGSRFELHLLLVENQAGYVRWLSEQARGLPNVYFHDPVPTESIAARINEYDLGVHILPPTNFNSRNALPNKFFEYVQARLGVAVSPSPAMSQLVREHHLGLVAPGFTAADMVIALKDVTAGDVKMWKEASDRAAKELSWDANREVLRRAVSQALQSAR